MTTELNLQTVNYQAQNSCLSIFLPQFYLGLRALGWSAYACSDVYSVPVIGSHRLGLQNSDKKIGEDVLIHFILYLLCIYVNYGPQQKT